MVKSQKLQVTAKIYTYRNKLPTKKKLFVLKSQTWVTAEDLKALFLCPKLRQIRLAVLAMAVTDVQTNMEMKTM